MNPARAQYFLAVAETGTVTAAAAQLGVAQPAVSRQLQQIERELGVRLFQREGRRLGLTAAGRAFVPLAAEFVTQTQELDHAAARLAGGRVRRLLVVAPQASITEILAPFVATLAPSDPLIRVEVGFPLQTQSALRSGADLVMTTEPSRRSLAGQSVTDVPLLAYVTPSHPWAQARRQAVTVRELVAESLILLPDRYMTRRILDQAVTAGGLAYGPIEECPDSRVIQALAAAGFGIGVVTDLPRFDVHSVVVTDSSRAARPLLLNIRAAWDPKHYGARTIESLVTRMARHAREERQRRP